MEISNLLVFILLYHYVAREMYHFTILAVTVV